jgi:hypothetical protein
VSGIFVTRHGKSAAAPDRLAYLIAAHVWQATPGLRRSALSGTPGQVVRWVGELVYERVRRLRARGGGVKQAADRFTPDFLERPRRGRPRKPDALTPAARSKAYRARRRAQECPRGKDGADA